MRTRSDDLTILLTVVDTKGFTAAAQALNLQVAKVSRAVARVEQQLGISILNRTTRRLSLTDEGRVFVDSIRCGLNLLQKAEDELVSRKQGPEGRLRVDAASPFLLHQLVPLVQGFREEYPGIQLELSSNEGFVNLLEEQADVAIRIGQLEDSTLHARPLGKSLLYVVAAPEYLALHGYPENIEALAHHQRIGFLGAKALNEWPLPGVQTHQVKLAASNGESVRQLAIMGNGIACLSGYMVKNDIAAGRLVALFEDEKQIDTGREQIHAVYYRTSALAKRISAFLDFIQPRLNL